jgi:twitching motility protein PilJ
MNLFRHLKITHQFLILFGVLIIGFFAIGLAYRQVLEVERVSASLLQQTNSFGDLVNQVSNDISAMNAEEKEFLLTHKQQHADNFDTLLSPMHRKINTLEETVPEERALGLVTQLREALIGYQQAFHTLTETQAQLGLDETSGLYGQMHAAANALTQTLRDLDKPQLVTSLLQIRNLEKDFIQHSDFKYIRGMETEQASFTELLQQSGIPVKAREEISREMASYTKAFAAVVRGTELVQTRDDDLKTAFYILNPLLESLLQQKDEVVKANLLSVRAERDRITYFFIAAIIVVGILVAGVLMLLAQRMRRSLNRLHNTVQLVSAGDFSARSRLASGDELGALSDAFDNLLDERVATLSRVEKENEELNDSIISLMGVVAQLSQKDLRVKAEVAEDVTGPMADAVNLMTSETIKVLTRIREVSVQVEQVANTVRTQGVKVTEVASKERQLVQESADELKEAGVTMTKLAKEAKGANQSAGVAMSHTRNAREAVSTTVDSIEQIREIIRETEKRIKRLGERSQEITGAVNLINTIAERTHILALNASMHAASAGEAGRGFAVVADEVQRLAENSRGATSDIASMVNAIRVETADTVDAMNRVIAQVADGTRLAQVAGERMQETETTTANLVTVVGEIAQAAEQQARRALELIKLSQVILKSTELTGQELVEQSAQTINLVEFANSLREAVGVFKLPEKVA